MDQVTQFIEPSRQFVKDSIRLVKRCTKPDRKGKSYRSPDVLYMGIEVIVKPFMFFFSLCLEFQKIAMATAIGFAIMGFIGFFVKLIHIPINNIIV